MIITRPSLGTIRLPIYGVSPMARNAAITKIGDDGRDESEARPDTRHAV